MELAKSISQKLGKSALAAEVNGHVVSLDTQLHDGDTVRILTFADQQGRDVLRHTASHILAQAFKRVFKDRHVKLGIGPPLKTDFITTSTSTAPFRRRTSPKLRPR